MNLRFWGGWFLAIAGISILLTMGCEKGALGVKPATIVGQVVDKDNPSIPVANAVVRMISKEAVGTSELVQGNNFVSAVTGVDGKFVFESVQADNVVFEYSAPGYASMIYPKPSSGDDESEGSTAEIEFVSVRSGAFLDLRMLPLQKISNPLPATVNVKLDLVDATTKQSIIADINGNPIKFFVSLNGKNFDAMEAALWRANGENVSASAEIKAVVRHEDGSLYIAKDDITINGSNDVFQRVELEPVTYQLSLRCLNVPDYMTGSSAVVNLFAEIPADADGTGKPAQIIKSGVMNAFGDMYVLSLPGLALQNATGMDLRIQVRGYYDEIIRFTNSSLGMGTRGNYRLDIDFLAKDSSPNNVQNGSSPIILFSNSDPVVKLYDNMKTRDVYLVVTNLGLNDRITNAFISLPFTGDPYRYYEKTKILEKNDWVATETSPITIGFDKVAVGYQMTYSIAIQTAASGTFSVYKSGLTVNPDVSSPSRPLEFTINWFDEYQKLKSAAN